MATIVLIVNREKKTSNVHTARNMDTRSNNVTARTKKTSTACTARKVVTQLKNVT